MLLGREPLNRQPIKGLHTDAITLMAEVIESKRKPTQPWGNIAQAAFGEVPSTRNKKANTTQSIIAIGRQDIDPEGLELPVGLSILGASSDHLVVDSDNYADGLAIGSEVPFQLNYSALLRAMTSPFVAKSMLRSKTAPRRESAQSCHI